jgi:rRNA-processing protein EBP2
VVARKKDKSLTTRPKSTPLQKSASPPPQASLPDRGDTSSSRASTPSDIALSDLSSQSSAASDLIPHQRLTINNTSALLRAHASIAIPTNLPFSTTQVHISSTQIDIPDVNDDLKRELAFYAQCLEAANEGRRLLLKEGVPFTRPNDYFAEMVKSDEHMGKIKAKLTEDAAGKKAAAEARKLRDAKKFGKQVQVAKLQERDKARRETLDKIKVLKRSMCIFAFQIPIARLLIVMYRAERHRYWCRY